MASAQAAYTARRAADYGVLVEGAIRVDMPKVKRAIEKGDTRGFMKVVGLRIQGDPRPRISLCTRG